MPDLGFPKEIVSDNGKQFVSAEFENFLKSCGIKHTRVSPYFARSNGKLERFHRYLKKNFCAVISKGNSWEDELPVTKDLDVLLSDSSSCQWKNANDAAV